MGLDRLLERIWSSEIVAVDVSNASPVSLMLNSLLAAPVVSFLDISREDISEPFVCYGGYEILPGANLADVLLEELGVEVDEGSVILVEPRSHFNAAWDSADDLGRLVGRILVSLSKIEAESRAETSLSDGLFGNAARTGLSRQSAVN